MFFYLPACPLCPALFAGQGDRQQLRHDVLAYAGEGLPGRPETTKPLIVRWGAGSSGLIPTLVGYSLDVSCFRRSATVSPRS